MSRSCNDCSLDNVCERQRTGTYSCSDGNEKTKKQRIQDIHNNVLNVIDTLENINREYASWDLWDRTRIIDDSINVLKNGYIKELYKKYDIPYIE